MRAVTRSTPLLGQSPWLSYVRPPVVYTQTVSDEIAISDSTLVQLVARIFERIGLAAAPHTSAAFRSMISEAITLDDAVFAAWQMTIADGVALNDSPEAFAWRTGVVADALVLSGIVTTALIARQTVASALALNDIASGFWGADVSDTIALSDTALARAQYYQRLIDSIALSDTPNASLRLVTLVRDDLAFSDALSVSATMHASVSDGIILTGTVWIAGELYDVIVMNAETKAVTRYENYPFESMCEFPKGSGYYIGAGEEGIDLLEGGTDKGAVIDWRLKSGAQPLAGGQVVNVPEVFIGFRSDGQIMVKIIPNEGTPTTYIGRPASDTRIQESRVKLGAGVFAQYLDVELYNAEGVDTDAELESLVWYPTVLSRRLR